MSARQRRSELAAIIASGIAKAMAASSESAGQSEVSAVDGLALSAGSRLSVPLAGTSDRNGPKAGAATTHLALQRDERVPPPGTILMDQMTVTTPKGLLQMLGRRAH